MKKIAKLLLVAIICSLVFTLASCGGTRYTITEKEWKDLEKTFENCTVKSEIFYGSKEQAQVSELKQADGIYCYCNGMNLGGSTESTVSVDDERAVRQIDVDMVEDSVDSFNSTSSTTADSYPKSDTANDFSSSSDIFVSGIGSGGMILYPMSGVNSLIVNSLIIYTSGSLGGMDLPPQMVTRPGLDLNDYLPEIFQQNTYAGSYLDDDGNTYVNMDLNAFVNEIKCYKQYEGERYVEIEVLDENGKTVTKWTKDRSWASVNEIFTSDTIDYKDLKYDKKEKAYVHQYTHNEQSIKVYMYFENGKMMKAVSFVAFSDEDGKTFDVSNLTVDNVGGEGYYSMVTTYSDYGKTKVDHKFNKNDIITKIED